MSLLHHEVYWDQAQAGENVEWMPVMSSEAVALNEEEALDNLCCSYWRQFFSFIHRRGYRPEDAEDLTQEFFARLFKGKVFSGMQEQLNRGGAYLFSALKNFLATEWNREHCLKRGGGKVLLSLNSPETSWESELIDRETPESALERTWVVSILDGVLQQLEEEYESAGKQRLFEALRDCLPGSNNRAHYASIAKDLNMAETAVRMAAWRLRARYAKLVRVELEKQLEGGDGVEAGIRDLMAASARA